jgi:hypothetical protein
MKYVYLSCPITGLTAEELRSVSAAHHYLAQELAPDIHVLSPLRGKIADGKLDPKTHLVAAKAITARDRFDIKRADLMLVYFVGKNIISVGSAVEFGWADAYRVPIIVVSPSDTPMMKHGIIETLTDFVVDDLDGAVDLIRNILI